MLVSDSYKFVFHHVPKTGGTSITAALAPYSNLWKGTLPSDEKHGWQVQFHNVGLHLPVKEVIDSVNNYPKGYFSFAFVRNPFEVMVSAWDSEKYKEFDAYVEHEVFTGLQICARRTQYEYLTDEEGSLLVDFVGRYENLSGDFYEIAIRNLERLLGSVAPTRIKYIYLQFGMGTTGPKGCFDPGDRVPSPLTAGRAQG